MSHDPVTISIDLGVTGALVAWQNGKIIRLVDLPTETGDNNRKRISAPKLFSMLSAVGHRKEVVYEKVHAMPTGTLANFSMGYTLGTLEGICAVLDTPTHQIPPKEWRAALGLNLKGGTPQAKTEAREHAALLFDDQTPYLQRIKDHNRAEAILIGHYHLHYP